MIDPITPLLIKVLPVLAKHCGQLALKQVYPPVARAVKATADDYPRYPLLQHWLSAWCGSPEFFELQGLCREGEKISPEAVFDSFVQFVGIIDPNRSRSCAQEVLPVFLRHIDEQELGAPLAVVDHRNQMRADELGAQLQQITSIVSSSQQLLIGLLAPSDNLARSAKETALDAQLDMAKRLIDAWRPRAAELILSDIRPKLGSVEVSVALRFRLESLTGCVRLAANDAKQAQEHFRVAVELDPGNARARANLSTAKARTGLGSEAFEDAKKALALSPEDAYVASIYLRRLAESARFSEIEEFLAVQAEKLADPHFLAAVGDAYWSQGRRQDLVTIIQPRLRSEVQYAPAWELVGRTLLMDVQESLRAKRILPWQMPAHLRQMIQDAESALSETISIIGATDGDAGLAGVYANRACARTIQARLAEAEHDIDQALSLKQNLPEANHAKAVLLIDRREYRAALEYLHRIEPADLTIEMREAIGCSYLRLNQPRDAIKELAPLLRSTDSTIHEKVVAAEMLVQAHHQLTDAQASQGVVARLKEIAPDDAEVLCVESQHKERSGDIEGARFAVERAARLVGPEDRSFVTIDLASFYFRQGLYRDAAHAYTAICGPNANRAIRDQYVESLVRSDQIGRAYKFVRRARLEEGFDASLAHVEFQLCEHIGDLNEANSLLAELEQRVPTHRAHYTLRLATNYYRRANREACRNALNAVTISELAGFADEMMQAAKLRRWLGMDGVLDFGYAAWMAGRDRPEIALRYLSLTLAPQSSDRALLEQSPIRAGSRVIIRRGEESRIVDLIGEEQPEEPPARIRITSPLGRKLANADKGAEIVIGADVYVVEAIQSKYVAAHQDILRDFPLAFPDHHGLQRLEVGGGDLTPVFAAVHRRHEYANGALRVYREKRAALGTLASVLGEPLLDVWLSLVASDSGDRVLAAEGSPQEVQFETETVAQASDVVLDATALLTAARLSILPLLKRRFNTIHVAQAVLDEFLDAAAVVDYGPEIAGRLGWAGDRYVMTQGPDEPYLRERAALLAILIPYLSTEVVLMPCRGRLEYGIAR